MKTKVNSLKAFTLSGLSASFFMLFLIWSGVAWGVAEVESRSQRASIDAEEGPSLDLLKKMEFLQREVQELRGKVEEQGYQVQQLQDHQKKLYIDLDKRLREGGAVKQLSSATNAGTGAPRDEQVIVTDEPDTPAAVPVTASNEPMESEEKLYQKAYQLIQSKDYDNGIKAFQTLIANYPQGKYIPNANYWLGEVYLIKGNLQLAQTAFTNVYRNHPQHPKAGDCLLKLGYIEYSKGHFQQAEELLIKVKNQFPGSTSAQLADARLHKMRLEGSSVQ